MSKLSTTYTGKSLDPKLTCRWKIRAAQREKPLDPVFDTTSNPILRNATHACLPRKTSRRTADRQIGPPQARAPTGGVLAVQACTRLGGRNIHENVV